MHGTASTYTEASDCCMHPVRWGPACGACRGHSLRTGAAQSVCPGQGPKPAAAFARPTLAVPTDTCLPAPVGTNATNECYADEAGYQLVVDTAGKTGKESKESNFQFVFMTGPAAEGGAPRADFHAFNDTLQDVLARCRQTKLFRMLKLRGTCVQALRCLWGAAWEVACTRVWGCGCVCGGRGRRCHGTAVH